MDKQHPVFTFETYSAEISRASQLIDKVLAHTMLDRDCLKIVFHNRYFDSVTYEDVHRILIELGLVTQMRNFYDMEKVAEVKRDILFRHQASDLMTELKLIKVRCGEFKTAMASCKKQWPHFHSIRASLHNAVKGTKTLEDALRLIQEYYKRALELEQHMQFLDRTRFSVVGANYDFIAIEEALTFQLYKRRVDLAIAAIDVGKRVINLKKLRHISNHCEATLWVIDNACANFDELSKPYFLERFRAHITNSFAEMDVVVTEEHLKSWQEHRCDLRTNSRGLDFLRLSATDHRKVETSRGRVSTVAAVLMAYDKLTADSTLVVNLENPPVDVRLDGVDTIEVGCHRFSIDYIRDFIESIRSKAPE